MLTNKRVHWPIFKSLTNDLVYCSTHENVAVSTHAAFVTWRTSWKSTSLQTSRRPSTDTVQRSLPDKLFVDTVQRNPPRSVRKPFVDIVQRNPCHAYTVAQRMFHRKWSLISMSLSEHQWAWVSINELEWTSMNLNEHQWTWVSINGLWWTWVKRLRVQIAKSSCPLCFNSYARFLQNKSNSNKHVDLAINETICQWFEYWSMNAFIGQQTLIGKRTTLIDQCSSLANQRVQGHVRSVP